jgi:hypothetical protein
MDAAWACYEAWAWLQLNHGRIALVYGIGRGSLSQDLDQVMPAQLDPYFLTPLRPHRDAIAGLQANAAIAAGLTSELYIPYSWYEPIWLETPASPNQTKPGNSSRTVAPRSAATCRSTPPGACCPVTRLERPACCASRRPPCKCAG